MKPILIGCGIAVLALTAAVNSDVMMWNDARLKSMSKSLAPKVDAQKIATEPLGNFGNYSMLVAHREGSGVGELHEKQADVFFVISGEATLLTGGTMPDSKHISADEVRGPSIQGGEKKQLGKGDVVRIPAKTPHQLLLEPGKQFTYTMVKVNTE